MGLRGGPGFFDEGVQDRIELKYIFSEYLTRVLNRAPGGYCYCQLEMDKSWYEMWEIFSEI